MCGGCARRWVATGPLVSHAGGYVLRVEPGQLDLEVFERLLGEGRAALSEGRAQAASVALAEALALWHGPALAEFDDQPFAREAAGGLRSCAWRRSRRGSTPICSWGEIAR